MKAEQVGEHLSSGGILAYPTETVRGLGVDALRPQAVENLFELKGRDSTKAMSILVRDIHMAEQFADLSAPTKKLMRVCWPGPMTFVVPLKDKRLDLVSGQSGFVGLRCSSHPLINDLVWTYQNPITTTSANRSGQPSALSDSDLTWLPRTVLTIGHGEVGSGHASAVAKITGTGCELLRESEIDREFFQRLVNMCGLHYQE